MSPSLEIIRGTKANKLGSIRELHVSVPTLKAPEKWDPDVYLNEARAVLVPELRPMVRLSRRKIQLFLKVQFFKKDPGVHPIFIKTQFRTKPMEVLNETKINLVLIRQGFKIMEYIDTFTNQGSGWQFDKILSCKCKVYRFRLATGGNYLPLPYYIEDKQACINPQNKTNDYCLPLAWLISELPEGTVHPERESHFINKKQNLVLSDTRFSDLVYPVTLDQLPALEEKTKTAIYVFQPAGENEKPCVNILYKSQLRKGEAKESKYFMMWSEVDVEEELADIRRKEVEKQEKRVQKKKDEGKKITEKDIEKVNPNFIPLSDRTDPVKCHFATIKGLKGLKRLMYSATKHKEQKGMCHQCFQLYSEDNLKAHESTCEEKDNKLVKFPDPSKPNAIKKFRNYYKSLRVPLSIVADFEAINEKLEKVAKEMGIEILPKKSTRGRKKKVVEDQTSATKKKTEHKPCGYCLYVVAANGEFFTPVLKRVGMEGIKDEKDLMEAFATDIKALKKMIQDRLSKTAKMTLTPEQQKSFKDVQKCGGNCFICNEAILSDNEYLRLGTEAYKEAIEAAETDTICAMDRKLKSKGDKDKAKERYERAVKKQQIKIAKLKEGEHMLMKYRVVRDHDHLTGEFRGLAHSHCNWRYSTVKVPTSEKTKDGKPMKLPEIPVIFHNLKGYDGHLILSNFSAQNDGTLANCIAQNSEKYTTFSIDNLKFIDSNAFLLARLETLVKNLRDKGKGKDKFVHLNNFINTKYSHKTAEERAEIQSLLLRKGVFPYKYLDSFERFNETCLPPIEEFFSDLSKKGISEKDYQHALNVWRVFEMKTFAEYHDLYLLTDVLLLADVFENFRDLALKNYGLDPCHFLTSPGLAGDAMLKMTKVELQVFSGEGALDKYAFFEKGVRGGMVMISNRYAKANNKYLKNHNPALPSSFIAYFDANNLYGWAMGQKLPVRNFNWIEARSKSLEEWKDFIMSIPDDASIGYTFEVDMSYTEDLHDAHNDYPLGASSMYAPGTDETTKKLIPHLGALRKHVIHYRLLKTYIKYGRVLEAVHRGMSYEQEAYMKPFIDFNTELRAQAKNEQEKNQPKLIVNSNFGKALENKRHHIDIRLVTNDEQMLKLISNPRFDGLASEYGDDLFAVGLEKASVMLDNPIFVGQSILDISKVLMYEFHYGYIKPKYGKKARLLFTDTDSLCYHIETEDLYKDMQEKGTLFGKEQHLFDTSDFLKDHPSGLFSLDESMRPNNKKQIGFFKDECCGVQFIEFVGLRAKMYALRHEENGIDLLTDKRARKEYKQEKKVAKGVPKSCIDLDLTFEHYLNVLNTSNTVYCTANAIRSKDHKLNTVELTKVALTGNDTKRYLLKDGSHRTLAHGHKDNPIKIPDAPEQIKKE